jgi:hypothetical protein
LILKAVNYFAYRIVDNSKPLLTNFCKNFPVNTECLSEQEPGDTCSLFKAIKNPLTASNDIEFYLFPPPENAGHHLFTFPAAAIAAWGLRPIGAEYQLYHTSGAGSKHCHHTDLPDEQWWFHYRHLYTSRELCGFHFRV